MSNDTATPKTSILTDAMNRAKAKMTTDPSTEVDAPTEKKLNVKRAVLIGAGATLTAGAAVYAAIKLFTGAPVEDEISEDDESND